MRDLEALASTSEFSDATQNERAEMLVWLLDQGEESIGVKIKHVGDAFEKLKLARPNTTRLKQYFKRSRNVRTLGNGNFQVVRSFVKTMDAVLPAREIIDEGLLDVDLIELPPFVSPARKDDLKKMVHAYARLFLLENSMRGLIEDVLSNALGSNWWEIASNKGMQKKHSDRVQNEISKKWAPARSDFGPLYALDWGDLVTIIRKYPDYFGRYISDPNFLHRFEDAGTFRNIVAHNGVLRNEDDFELIRIYYRNWIQQLN